MDSDAIVLDTTEHGESDLIVTFFCQENGRLSAIAKGAKKSKKRFVNKLEPFTFLRITYDKRVHTSLAFLKEAELHSGFLNLRKDVTLFKVASIINEFLLLSVKEGEPETNLFRLSLWAFHSLDSRRTPETILALFLIKYLSVVGYRPDLDRCQSCNLPFNPDLRYSFNVNSGLLTCSLCGRDQRSGKLISRGTIKMIQTAQNLPLERLHRVNITGSILKETLTILHNFCRQIFQREIVSWKVLNKGKPG